MELIQILKALGDDTRIRIINILSKGALCVCEIEEILNITQSNASRHLNKLMNAKLVTYYKEAKFVYYKIDEKTIEKHPFIKEIIDS
ncbi:MAG: ArsR/SmtB family transcription factor [Paraclostridium sp.]